METCTQMDVKDIAKLFVDAVSKVEFYWQFYTVTLLAMIGWLVSTKRVLAYRLKLLITVGYVVFAAMNLVGLWDSYDFTAALRQDLLAATETMQDTLTHTRAVLGEPPMVSRKTVAIGIHAILAAAVLTAIWFRGPEQEGGGTDS